MLKQPNKWSCLPTAFAMALGISIEEMIKRVGHDGSEIVFQGSYPWKAFNIMEMIEVCLELGYSATPIFSSLVSENPYTGERSIHCTGLAPYLENYSGVIMGKFGENAHAAYYNGVIHDPNGKIYPLPLNLKINQFWIISPMSESNHK